MNRKLKKIIKQNFSQSCPLKKDEFISSLNFPKTTYKEVFFNQFHYISKSFWAFSIAILAFIYYISNIKDPQSTQILSSFVPLISLISVIELHKSSSYNMEELELTLKHNLAQITLIKLIIVGFVSLLVLSIAMIFISVDIFSILTPYLAITFVSLLETNLIKGIAGIYACIGVTSIILTINSLIILNKIIIQLDAYIIISGILLLLIVSQLFILFIKNGGNKWVFA